MEVLRTAVSLLSLYDADEKDSTHDANLRKAYRLTSQIAMIVAVFDRIRKGKAIVEPDPSLCHCANFLRMLNGEKPPDDSDTRTGCGADPAGRPRVECQHLCGAGHRLDAGRHALGHHRRDRRAEGAAAWWRERRDHEAAVRDREAGTDPTEYVRQMFAEKKKISGFGHRVYTTEDPRATHLRQMSESLGKASGNPKWFDMSQKIEHFVKQEKKLNANVDFYSASTYTTLGIDIDLFTPIFAMSRIAGWAAHVIEQLDDNRLIRPRADYVGPEYPDAVCAAKRAAVVAERED